VKISGRNGKVKTIIRWSCCSVKAIERRVSSDSCVCVFIIL